MRNLLPPAALCLIATSLTKCLCIPTPILDIIAKRITGGSVRLDIERQVVTQDEGLQVASLGVATNGTTYRGRVLKMTQGGTSPALNSPRAFVIPQIDDMSFWFAEFNVGDGGPLSLLIDTGSADVYLNPGSVYRPSQNAVNLHQYFGISFATSRTDGSGTTSLAGALFNDTMTIPGTVLKVDSQTIGNTTTLGKPFPHDGLVGYGGSSWSAFGGTSFFQGLCHAGLLRECRFGLAMQANGRGTQILGAVSDVYQNQLSVAPLSAQFGEWSTWGDIHINDQLAITDQLMVFDSGTTVIYGPINKVKDMYDRMNITTTFFPATRTRASYLYASFPCSSPPVVGFGLPSAANASASVPSSGGGRPPDDTSIYQSPYSTTSTTFNISPKVWATKLEGAGFCTGVVQGTDAFGNFWLVGQAFMQGKYVDHDITGQTLGFADVPEILRFNPSA